MQDWIDFARLGWKAFQDLCFAVSTEVLGQTVEYFLPQKDGGRDGAFAGTWKQNSDELNGTFCVQCKYTSDTNKNLSSKTFLKQEEPKIRRLVHAKKCDAYILLTNCAVTHHQKDEIEVALKKTGVKHVRIFAKDWLTVQIQKNSRLRMMVPRVYGLGDLSAILDQNGAKQGHLILSSIKDELQKFVITHAYKNAAEAISDHGFVILLGAPATGKSTIAACLSLAALDRWKIETIKLPQPEDFLTHWAPGSDKRFFWIDDAFGATQLDLSQINKWNQLLPHINAAHKSGYRFVFTSRDYIFEGAKNFLKQAVLPILFESQIVIRVEDLTLPEKQQILYNHVKLGNQPPQFRKKIKPFLNEVTQQPGFMPEIARRLGDSVFTKRLSLTKDSVLDFVNKPREFLREVIKGLDSPSFSALGLIFLNGGSLPAPFKLSPEAEGFLQRHGVTEFSVSEALLRLKNSLTRLEDTTVGSVWKFKHPTIADAYADIVSGDPQKMEYYLRGATVERIMSEISCGKPPAYGTSILVPSNMYPLVSMRLFEATEQREIHSFLAYRCGAEFLQLYMKDRKLRPLDFLPPGGMLSVFPQVDVFATLCAAGLTSQKERKSFISHCLQIAIKMPEPGFVTSARYAPIFGDEKIRAAIRKKFVAAIVPNIEERVEDAWLNSSSEDDAYWLDLLRQSATLAEDDPRYNKDMTLRNARQRAEEYLRELNEKTQNDSDGDPDDSLFDKAEIGALEKAQTAAERSIFDDVDI